MKKLNLGCGKDIKSDCVNMDLVKREGVLLHDLSKLPWPFKDNEFDIIYAHHIIEHLDDVIKTLEEIYRISKKDTLVYIKVPHYGTEAAHIDPTHKHFFSENSFDWYFTKKQRMKFKFKFDILNKEIVYNNPRFLRIIPKKIRKNLFLNQIYELKFTLKIQK